MPAGLGGGGYLIHAFESAVGTYVEPNAAGAIAIPIIDESLEYNEDKYTSPAIRQQTIISDAKPSYYSVGGDITVECDARYEPYFLHLGRHVIAKAGAGTPWTYTYTPSQAGASSTAATGNVARTASLTIYRNGVGFGYAGCSVAGYEYTIEDGVLRCTYNIVGTGEQTPVQSATPTWQTPALFGADAHRVYIDAAGLTPAFASADVNHNGFTFRSNFNAEAQNRIVAARSATYVAFGETEAGYETELDFLSKTEYDNFKATTFRAIRLLSANGGATLTAATDGIQITSYRSFYETYGVNLPGMGDLIMAGVTGRLTGIAGGDPYKIEVKSPTNIT